MIIELVVLVEDMNWVMVSLSVSLWLQLSGTVADWNCFCEWLALLVRVIL